MRIRCRSAYVAIDLKMGKFKPEYSGKMSFYVSAVDDLLRHPDDRQTIGLILCKSRNQTIAEYALRDVNKPIAIARYQQELPEELRGVLPSVAQLEMALNEITEGKGGAIDVQE